MPIEAVIFDIGNVLVRFDWQLAEQQFRTRIGNDTKEAREELFVLKERLELGRISQEGFVREAIRAVGFCGRPDEFATIWNCIFWPNEPMGKLIVGLSKSLPLYLLSNTSELHLAHLTKSFEILRHFTDGVYSCRVECAKPDGRIFEIAAKRFGVIPSRTLYVDDLAVNIESAAGFGFRAIQYEWQKHLEFQETLACLISEGISDFGLRIWGTQNSEPRTRNADTPIRPDH
jgi:FMN phosphatase YigB (HAD superfamily)